LQLPEVRLGALGIGFGLVELRLRHVNVSPVEGFVDMRQHGTLLDRRAVVNQFAVVAWIPAQGVDHASDLRPNVDDFFRFDRAGSADGGHQVTTCDWSSAVGDWYRHVALPVPPDTRAEQTQADE
jgi:hypothetical protein